MVAMPQKQNSGRMTEAEYYEFERNSDIKYEFLNGEVYAMAGASYEHNQIFSATLASLFAKLRGKGCIVNPSDQKLKVMETGFIAYPDISVICGEPIFAGEEYDTITNPVLIIEILSPSTEGYDRGKKFQNYREIPTLQEYLLISQDKAHIEAYTMQNGKWVLTDIIGLDSIYKFSSVDCQIALADVYETVTFPENNEPETD